MSSVFQDPGVELAFRKFYNLAILTDGSIHRAPYNPPPLPPCPFPSSPDQVATKDLPLNHGHGTWARLFLPPLAGSSSQRKLPILLYFHGGGFLNSTTARPSYHAFLCKLAAHANSLIVSVDYRLAPESPLPAAYEDCFEALLWLNNQAKLGTSSADPWLAHHADFSRCFMGGDSAGANIAHHVAMKAAGFGAWGQGGGGQEQLGLGQNSKHISVQGLMIIHPFFSCGAATVGVVEANVWKYSGVSLDHPFADPLSSGAPSLVRAALPPMLVAIAGSDHLRDRGLAYHQGLVDAGKEAKIFVSENEIHVFHLQTPDSKNVPPFLDELRDFINLTTH